MTSHFSLCTHGLAQGIKRVGSCTSVSINTSFGSSTRDIMRKFQNMEKEAVTLERSSHLTPPQFMKKSITISHLSLAAQVSSTPSPLSFSHLPPSVPTSLPPSLTSSLIPSSLTHSLTPTLSPSLTPSPSLSLPPSLPLTLPCSLPPSHTPSLLPSIMITPSLTP